MIYIGRIRIDEIKKTSFELMGRYPDRFSDDFEKNKEILNKLKIITEIKLRNRIAGYITRATKAKNRKAN